MTEQEQQLIDLEHEGWQTLTGSGDPAEFYSRILTDDPLMLLPGGLRLTGREQILATMSGPPWDRFEIEAPAVAQLTHDVAVVHYSVAATRDGAQYKALMSSTYVRTNRTWRLAMHQQSAVG